jgi:hypothetical protein
MGMFIIVSLFSNLLVFFYWPTSNFTVDGVQAGIPLSEENFKNIKVPNVTIRQEIINDPDVQKFLQSHKVYISLTTSPTRISGIRYVLDTLDLKFVSKVFLNLPHVFSRTGKTYLIPESLVEKYGDKLVILKVHDWGPVTKVLPAIEYLQSRNEFESIVLSVDDDTQYVPSMVYEAVYYLVKHPDRAISGSGNCLSHWKMNPEQWPRQADCIGISAHVQVLEGFQSIAVRSKFYDPQLLKVLSSRCISKYCFVSDDITLSFHLALSGIDAWRVQIENFGGGLYNSLPWGFGGDALHRGGDSSENCLKDALDLADISQNEFHYRSCHHALKNLALLDGEWKSINQVKQDGYQYFQSLDEADSSKTCLADLLKSAIIEVCAKPSDCFGIHYAHR